MSYFYPIITLHGSDTIAPAHSLDIIDWFYFSGADDALPRGALPIL